MRNSLKLGFAFALGATAIFAGCSSGSDSTDSAAGTSAGGDAAGHAGTAAAGMPSGGSTSYAGSGGTSTNGGSSGETAGSGGTGGATAGSSGAGGTSGGAGGTSGGAAGHAGNAGAGGAGGATAGSAGTGGAGGASAGAGGATAGSAGTGGAAAGSGGASAGTGGTGGSDCADESTGLPAAAGAGTGGAPAATTAVILIDDVVVKKAATTLIQWQFATGDTIVNSAAGDAPPADKWARSNYGYTVSGDANAADSFLSCAGNPAAGSLKTIAPFNAAGQQFEIRVAGATLDYSNATVTAKIKLVGGGVPSASCPVKAWIYAVNNVGGTQTAANPVPLVVGQWTDATLTVPATGFDQVGLLGLRLTTFGCP